MISVSKRPCRHTGYVASLGPSWAILGPSWCHLGVFLIRSRYFAVALLVMVILFIYGYLLVLAYLYFLVFLVFVVFLVFEFLVFLVFLVLNSRCGNRLRSSKRVKAYLHFHFSLLNISEWVLSNWEGQILCFECRVCVLNKIHETKQPSTLGPYPSDLDEIGCQQKRCVISPLGGCGWCQGGGAQLAL
jgi:hypothetical protein